MLVMAAASGMKTTKTPNAQLRRWLTTTGCFSQIDWVPIRFSTRRILYDE